MSLPTRGRAGRSFPQTAHLVACMILVTAAFSGIIQTSQAATVATIYFVKMYASPPVTSPGKSLTIHASVEITGACCYEVYVRNTTAELKLPKGLHLVSGTSTQFVTSQDQTVPGMVTGPKAGLLTKISLQWTVAGDDYGTYAVSLLVGGYSIGPPDQYISKTGQMIVTISNGVVISEPIIQPEYISQGSALHVMADINSVLGTVNDALLNYSWDNSTWLSIRMTSPVEGSSRYVSNVPGGVKGQTFYYYIYARDSFNYSSETGIYVVQTASTSGSDTEGVFPAGWDLAFLVGFVLFIALSLIILIIGKGKSHKGGKKDKEVTQDDTKTSQDDEQKKSDISDKGGDSDG